MIKYLIFYRVHDFSTWLAYATLFDDIETAQTEVNYLLSRGVGIAFEILPVRMEQ